MNGDILEFLRYFGYDGSGRVPAISDNQFHLQFAALQQLVHEQTLLLSEMAQRQSEIVRLQQALLVRLSMSQEARHDQDDFAAACCAADASAAVIRDAALQ